MGQQWQKVRFLCLADLPSTTKDGKKAIRDDLWVKVGPPVRSGLLSLYDIEQGLWSGKDEPSYEINLIQVPDSRIPLMRVNQSAVELLSDRADGIVPVYTVDEFLAENDIP